MKGRFRCVADGNDGLWVKGSDGNEIVVVGGWVLEDRKGRMSMIDR